ncbi:hypothetical protein N431DRAFT_460741 [Stipitochalara longipes BDJ]|nr:hypothetical protein N431DRAFT_460741 [Stipitochalara longipes BDJ]
MSVQTKPAVVVTFLYPRKGMPNFDKKYYLNHHIPATEVAWRPLGMTNCVVCEIGDDAEFSMSVVTFWKSDDEWEIAKGGKAAQRLAEDVKNFTDVDPVVIVGKVVN